MMFSLPTSNGGWYRTPRGPVHNLGHKIVPRRGYEAPKGAGSKEKPIILAKTQPLIFA